MCPAGPRAANDLVVSSHPGAKSSYYSTDRTAMGKPIHTVVPMWGFSSSPLVLGPVVVVYGGGAGEKGLLAFETASGDLRWSVPCPVNSYGSPQLDNILGEDSMLMLSSSGLVLLDPANGKTRLDYEWKITPYQAVQPHVVGNDTILLPTCMNMGTRAI